MPDEPVVHPPGRAATHPERPSGLPAVKTREVYIRQQTPASAQPPTEATIVQGKQKFVQAQGRKRAVKQSGRRRDLCEGNARRTPRQGLESSATPAPAQKQHGDDRGSQNQHPPVRRTAHRPGKAAEQTAQHTVRGIKASKKAVKDTGRAAKQTIKTTSRSTKQTVKTADHTVKVTQKTAQVTVKATQRAVQAARATAKTAATTAKAAAKATVAAIKAAMAAI